MHRSLIKLVYATLLVFLSLAIGTSGFMFIEGYSAINALYMSLITFSTIGFAEVQPLSEEGKLFTMIYIFINLGIFAYTVSVLSSFFFEGELQKIFKRYIVTRDMKRVKDHIIVCGFGKLGQNICNELLESKKQFIIIEQDINAIEHTPESEKFQFIQGDATLDETLIDAGLERARAVVTALPNDADNVFITLTAKTVNPTLKVIAKASDANAEKKLYRAGATHVVTPGKLGGTHMANLITKPYVIEFLNILNGVGSMELELEDVEYAAFKPEYRDKTLRELDIRHQTGVTVIAFKNHDGQFNFNPHASNKIQQNDILIILGASEHIENFKSLFLLKNAS